MSRDIGPDDRIYRQSKFKLKSFGQCTHLSPTSRTVTLQPQLWSYFEAECPTAWSILRAPVLWSTDEIAPVTRAILVKEKCARIALRKRQPHQVAASDVCEVLTWLRLWPQYRTTRARISDLFLCVNCILGMSRIDGRTWGHFSCLSGPSQDTSQNDGVYLFSTTSNMVISCPTIIYLNR